MRITVGITIPEPKIEKLKKGAADENRSFSNFLVNAGLERIKQLEVQDGKDSSS